MCMKPMRSFNQPKKQKVELTLIEHNKRIEEKNTRKIALYNTLINSKLGDSLRKLEKYSKRN